MAKIKKFIISTDTCSDKYLSEMKAQEIEYIPMAFIVNGEPKYLVYDSMDEVLAFYKKMDDGLMPTTSQLNAFETKEYFEKLLEKHNMDIVHFALSGGLSGTAQGAIDAANEINAENKYGHKVYAVDSLSATQGITLLIDRAVEFRDAGKTAAETFEMCEALKHNVHHWVIVTNLNHMKRGGRVSGASAFLGTILKIRPIITMDPRGKLIIVQKVIGQKKAIDTIMESIYKHGADLSGQTVYIANTDTAETAAIIEQRLKAAYSCKVKQSFIGPVIGSHTGSGTLSVMFVGGPRVQKTKD